MLRRLIVGLLLKLTTIDEAMCDAMAVSRRLTHLADYV